MEKINIATIEPQDNSGLAEIIRGALAEFGANKPGTVYYDPTTDALFELFQTAGSIYFVAKEQGEIIGGAGIFPSNELPEGVCELVKMYLKKEVRGRGLGKLLIEKCLTTAKEMGYQKVYLETLPELRKAVSVYEKFGFRYLEAPMGDTGHFGCDVWMIKNL
jgi:putative acetyltransferase